MKNRELARDYFERAGHRLAALEVLMERKSYADVVREAQETIELCLKALLMQCRIEVPRIHDVGSILQKEKSKLPATLQIHVDRLAAISKDLRRDRELAFYGTEDLTPSQFYQETDGRKALDEAQWVHSVCEEIFSRN